MNAVEQSVLNYLQQNAIGKANAKTADIIQGQFDLPQGRTQEPVREIIRNLVINHQALIGSGRNGYFIIDNEEDLERAIADLQSRANENNRRATALRDNWNLGQ